MYLLQNAKSLDALIEAMGNKRVVMLGEASHGTHEYYTWRAAISKRLIKEKGFSFIAVEGDWPDCFCINRFVKGYKDAGENIHPVLKGFDRWPTWMWANWEVASLAEWLRKHNDALPMNDKIGFYGLDVYSLWDSMTTMMNYLTKEDPAAANMVKEAIRCFEPYRDNEQLYAYKTQSGFSCRNEVIALMKEIKRKAHYVDGDREAGLNTEQNAVISVHAEEYYRSMMGFDNESWNIRDRHMIETLDRLMQFHGSSAKAIVWEHNTHIGDARATDMYNAGMVNTGQLARELYGEENVFLVGFGSYKGSVLAGDSWGAPVEKMLLPEARRDSIEQLLHEQSPENRYFIFKEENEHKKLFQKQVPHRAIGVVYNPAREKWGNYVPSYMTKRYDAFIYLDKTKALHPIKTHTNETAIPETYPFGE